MLAIASLEKENESLRARLVEAEARLGSISYQLGLSISEAIAKPGLKTFLAPFSIARLLMRWGMRKKNRSRSNVPDCSGALSSADECRPFVYLFMPINGVGLGHLTRCLAIAKRLRLLDPKSEIIFFTTSIAVALVHRSRFICYHIPPLNLSGTSVESSGWDDMFAVHLESIIAAHSPSVFIFDGSHPYGGIRRVLLKNPGIKAVWLKRGLFKSKTTSQQVDHFKELFDQVIVPGELGEQMEIQQKKSLTNSAVSVAPIIICDTEELLPRRVVLQQLNLSDQKKTVYLQLGAGNINDTVALHAIIIQALQKIPDLQLVLGRSPISLEQLEISGAVRVLEDYPNSKYFEGFDCAIVTAGYNSVYEAIFHSLPVVLVPNLDTKSDDQAERARLAAVHGRVRVLSQRSPDLLIQYVTELLQGGRESKREPFENGARAAARILWDNAKSSLRAHT